MSDFFEKETESVEEDGFSTVFSDPTEHRKIEIKAKKVWPKIVAAVLVVALLGGSLWAVLKFIEKKAEDTVTAENITVKELDTDSIKTVKVTNSTGTTEFYSVATEENEKLTTVEWYIRSLNKKLTDSTEICDVVQAVTSISAIREITQKSAENCGLINPRVQAVVTPREGDAYTVLLGDMSLDNSGYYMQIKGEEKIYIVPTDTGDALDYELLDFANTDIIPGITNDDGEIDDYYTDGTLAKFDKIILEGANHPEPVEIICNDDSETSQYLGYIVTKPSMRIAQNVDALLLMYQNGLEVLGAYSYDVKTASLKKFGLDNPDLSATIVLGNKKLTYKFSEQEDGYYAAVYNDSKLIHKIDATSLSGIIELSTTDYYSTWICYNSINDLSGFTIKTPDKSYDFGITKNETTESETETTEEQEDYTIVYNGKKLTALNFQYLYQYCVTLKCNDFTVEEVSGEPELVFVFKFKNGKESVIEFTKASATKYQYSVDGIDMGRVSTESIKKVIKNTEKVASGETITQIS